MSRWVLKQLTLGTVTISSGSLFQSAKTLSEKKRRPQFRPGEDCEDFLVVTTCLRVCCHCELGVLDLMNASDVFVRINKITTSPVVFQGWKSEMSRSV